MKRLMAMLVVAAVWLGVGLGQTTLPDAEAAHPVGSVPDHYIVQLADGVSPAEVLAAHGLAAGHTYGAVFNGFAGFVPAGGLAALQSDPRVVRIQPDHYVSVDGKPPKDDKGDKPGGGGGGGGKGGGGSTQVVPENIKRIGSDLVSQTGAGITIAIMDTGISHTDVNVVGCIDVFGGSCVDVNGHGTHVAGTAAALDNSEGVLGAAPGASVVAVKVLDDSGLATDADIIAAMDAIVAWNANAANPTIRVANASFGRAASSDDSLLHLAVQRLVGSDVLLVASAGNIASQEISGRVPAGFAEVVAVASTTAVKGSNRCRSLSGPIAADTASYFTTDGPGVFVSAPGEESEDIDRRCNIKSVGVLSLQAGGETTRMSGSSMASSAVTGVAALYFEANPGASVADAKAALANTALAGSAPLDSPNSSYSFDGVREGVLYAPNVLAP